MTAVRDAYNNFITKHDRESFERLINTSDALKKTESILRGLLKRPDSADYVNDVLIKLYSYMSKPEWKDRNKDKQVESDKEANDELGKQIWTTARFVVQDIWEEASERKRHEKSFDRYEQAEAPTMEEELAGHFISETIEREIKQNDVVEELTESEETESKIEGITTADIVWMVTNYKSDDPRTAILQEYLLKNIADIVEEKDLDTSITQLPEKTAIWLQKTITEYARIHNELGMNISFVRDTIQDMFIGWREALE